MNRTLMPIQNFKLKFFDKMKNRLIKCILKRYCGAYLEDFSDDQLSTGITAGKCALENLKLNVEELNRVSEDYNLPVEILHGSVDYVGASIPWTSIMSQNIVLEIRGLRIVVQPKSRPEDASIFDSTWGSQTSSMQLAKEISEDAEDDEYEDIGGSKDSVDTLAHVIDSILANIKIVFYDSSFKMEYVPEKGGTGIALEIKIASAEYIDEAGVNSKSSDNNAAQKKNDYEPQSYSFKRLIFEGISMFTSQFSDHSRIFSSKAGFESNCMDPSSFIPGSPEMPPTHSSFPVKRSEPEFTDDPVLISKLHGQQVLRLKLKQNEAIVGPKVDVEFNLGAFNLFLIPQQVHMLYELLSGIIKPSSFNESNKKLSVANKPMKATDYAFVQKELLRQQQKSDVPSKSLRNQQGWSSHSLDESDEEFQLMAMESRGGTEFPTSPLNDNDSLCSSISSDTRSDSTGNYYESSHRPSKPRGSTVQAMLQDQLSELTHFHGCFSSVLVIILHDDSVQESFGRDSNHDTKANSKSTGSLKERAETFFNEFLALQLSGQDFKDFASSRDPLSKLCNTNHLRLMASSVTIDGNEKSSSAQCVLNFSLSMLQFEVLECLLNSTNFVQEPTYVQLLSCDNIVKLDDDHTESEIASLKLRYQQTEYTTQSRHIKPPSNKLDVQFGLLSCEVDISITDRIQTLLNLFVPMDAKQNYNDMDTTRSSPKTEITISSPNLSINMRFPVPDLRCDMERVPWWQQNLHPEALIMRTKDVTLQTVLGGDDSQSKYEIQCRDVHGLLKKSEAEEPISFLRVSVDPDVDEITQNKGFDWPRLVIRQNTKAPGTDLNEPGLEDPVESFYSLSDDLMSNLGSDPTPFCSTSVAYGSKLHCRNASVEDQIDNSGAEQEEVIKPADKETLFKFVEDIINKSEYVLDFSLPSVNISFPDKEFFELLYNRLGSDLLLWQKTALATKAPYDPTGFNVHISGLDFNGHNPMDPALNNFPAFRPFANDSNSDSDDEETNYYSFYEKVVQKKQKHRNENSNNAFTKLSINISITKGSLAIHAPALDISNQVIPGVCGKLQLYAEEGQIFIASSYRGDPNESYLCILSEKSALYHNGAMPLPVELPTIEPLHGGKPNNIQCIIYESDPGMHLKPVYDVNGTTDMLKIAVHMVHTPKQQLKNFKVAIDISDATLRHYMSLVPQIWINQLIDFLKVQDFPVNGYVPSAVVTEFHLNLSNCAIDYRPLNLPLRSAITIENFNMSCNIAATTPTFLFRLISEEMRFFISSNMTAKKVDLQKNYVCVIDSGLIDVSFRTCVDDKKVAKLELSATNNIIHVRTCADSFKALMDLMIYASAQGDIETSLLENSEVNKESKSVSKSPDAENVHLLMAEAMKDCPIIEVPDYFPKRDSPENEVTVNTDDEFCILGDDAGVGLTPINGDPQIRVSTGAPIKIIENHFTVPPGKSDVLKAPKSFPKPVVLLTLREMSLVWHLYGGHDLKTNSGTKKSAKKKNKEAGVTFADTKSVDIDASNKSVTFCKVTPVPSTSVSNVVNFQMEQVIIEPLKDSNPNSWLQGGGVNRNHDILMELQMKKVKFQREVYPPDLKHASLYVLFVHDIEIIDRLKSSSINKFLYQYSSQKIPRQSNANMIEVKAVYTRPDTSLDSEECSLHVSCRPLRLNVDQDSFLFLVGFFRDSVGVGCKDSSEDSESSKEKDSTSPTNKVVHMPLSRQPITAPETFYRVFSFSRDVLIRIDYQGKRVLMEQGTLKGLLLGLGQLNNSEIMLKRICYRHGLLGHHKVLSHALNEWKNDIMKNQLPSILGGVGPMHSFVQLFCGAKDFILMPVSQYQKDGQIVRGLQRGASSFSSSAIMAFLDLCSGLVCTIHGAATVGFDMVSYGPSVVNRSQGSLEYHQPSQPADIREGLVTAMNVVKEGLGDTARNFYAVALTEHEHKGVPGAVGGILRQIPPTIFRPLIVGSRASNCILEGCRHQLMPDAHQEDIHKWRTKS